MQRLRLLVTLVVMLCVIHWVNSLLGYRLNHFGIAPRVLEHLPFILSAPFLHGSTAHLINNVIGLVTFGALCLLRGPRFFIRNSAIIIVLGGLAVWVFGRPAMHIGASGWVFGLWSLTIAMAWYQRSILNAVVALGVIFFYGGMIYGVLPGDARVSFESHLFGALAGVVAASGYARRGRRRKKS